MSIDSIPPYVPRPFQPPRFLANPHAQTLASEFLPRNLAARHPAWRQAETITTLWLPDGDGLLAHLHLHPDDPERQRPVVVHLHGLEGSAQSHYQLGLSAKAFAAGFHTVRVNFRNCGDTEHLARRIYNGAMTEDVAAVLDWLRRDLGLSRQLLTGVSFGGNLALKFLAECGQQPPPGVLAAATISAAIDFNLVTFSDGLSWVYERYFLAKLRRKMRRKVALSPGGAELEERVRLLGRVRTLREFDALVTAPLNGYESATHYYTRASAADDLDRVGVPTLLIHAEDDPFVPFEMYRSRTERIRANPMLVPVFPKHGGHVGFYAPKDLEWPEPWMDERWSENEAIAFLATLASERA